VEDGSVISGPPPKPLLALETEIVDGNIYVKVSEA
jgi:Rieske Fe-S protein